MPLAYPRLVAGDATENRAALGHYSVEVTPTQTQVPGAMLGTLSRGIWPRQGSRRGSRGPGGEESEILSERKGLGNPVLKAS